MKTYAFIKPVELPAMAIQKSFYGKAYFTVMNGVYTLYSYNTRILTFNVNYGEYRRYWMNYSATTMRHIKAFMLFANRKCAQPRMNKSIWEYMKYDTAYHWTELV